MIENRLKLDVCWKIKYRDSNSWILKENAIYKNTSANEILIRFLFIINDSFLAACVNCFIKNGQSSFLNFLLERVVDHLASNYLPNFIQMLSYFLLYEGRRIIFDPGGLIKKWPSTYEFLVYWLRKSFRNLTHFYLFWCLNWFNS